VIFAAGAVLSALLLRPRAASLATAREAVQPV
jgi:hypothetical protein